MNIEYRRATKEDAMTMVNIYNAAFYEDYVRYGYCPGYGSTREKMELSIEQTTKYIMRCSEVAVGVISFENKGEGNYYLGCLCVLPEYQGQGIGFQACQFMKSVCPDWKQISLVTPADKEENVRFYTKKCGFQAGHHIWDGAVELIEFTMSR